MADHCCNRALPANPNIKCSTHVKATEVQITLFRPFCPPDLNIIAVKAVHSNDQDYPCRWYIEYKFQQSMSEDEYENFKIRRILRRELEEWKPKNTLILAENLVKESGEHKWLVEYGVFCLCNRHQVFSLHFNIATETPADVYQKYCD